VLFSTLSPEWRNWQTRWTQNPVAARPCGFDPLLRDHFPIDCKGFLSLVLRRRIDLPRHLCLKYARTRGLSFVRYASSTNRTLWKPQSGIEHGAGSVVRDGRRKGPVAPNCNRFFALVCAAPSDETCIFTDAPTSVAVTIRAKDLTDVSASLDAAVGLQPGPFRPEPPKCPGC
jgi:hypothetical protein